VAESSAEARLDRVCSRPFLGENLVRPVELVAGEELDQQQPRVSIIKDACEETCPLTRPPSALGIAAVLAWGVGP